MSAPSAETAGAASGGAGASAGACGAAGSGRGPSRLEILLALEGQLRQLPSVRAVQIFAVNETRRLLDYSQAFFLSFDRRGRARMQAASGLSTIDRNAPLIRLMERLAQALAGAAEKAPARAGMDALVEQLSARDEETDAWPFRELMFLPLRGGAKGELFGGLLLARAAPWEEADAVIGERLAGAIAHALRALSPPSALRRFAVPRWALVVTPLLLLVLLLVPVPMMAVAPVEVVADEPMIVAAPMDGVISAVLKEPNTSVRRGEVLFAYDDTRLKAEAEVAAKREAVALTRLETLRKAAFRDPQARQKMAEARAELRLAAAERAYAEKLLAEVRVKAARDGVVIYSDRSEWIRRPVKTGEKVMEIADPARVVFRIDLPVKDAIAIRPGGRVRVFLDADPLHAIAARVRTASFHAEEAPGGILAYRILAEPEKDAAARLRIGFRGSAQLFGERASLGFYLLRRPIAAVRQFLGW